MNAIIKQLCELVLKSSELGLCLGWKGNEFVVSLEGGREGGRGGEGRGGDGEGRGGEGEERRGRERGGGGREGRDDCYTYYSDGTIYTDQQ